MAIKIGHASLGEDSKVHGGASGDQTGKEVCTRNWYDGGWHTVLRCKDAKLAEEMAKACEAACANKNIGYDQYQRNTLRNAAKAANWDLSKVGKCECDCSSLMAVCAECAGISVPYRTGNATTTSTIVSDFFSTGFFAILTDKKYLTSDKHLKRGDIIVKKGHVVMALQDGAESTFTLVTVKCPALKKGCNGEPVEALQGILNALGFECGNVDGDFGSKTDSAVRAFQKAKGLSVDGSVGSATWTALLN